MIALELIRNNPDEIVARYKKREKTVNLTEILEIDAKRRVLQQDVETKKAQRNKVSAEVPMLKKQGKDVAPVVAEMKALGEKIAVLDKELNTLTEKINYKLMCLPNLIALIFLSNVVVKITKNYFARKKGENLEPMISAYKENLQNETQEDNIE